MRTLRDERGFSLLLVMLVMIVMAVVGVTAARIGASDATTATAHSQRSQALLAAEMGMAIVTASGNGAAIEAIVAAKDEQLTLLPSIDLDADGTADHQPAFVVYQGLDGAFVVEGQLRDEDGRVVSRARLSGLATTSTSGDQYEGQVGMNPRSTGVLDERGVDAAQIASPL